MYSDHNPPKEEERHQSYSVSLKNLKGCMDTQFIE